MGKNNNSYTASYIKSDKFCGTTRIKPRSRPPQKKSAYFTHPDFSAAKIKVRKLREHIRYINFLLCIFPSFKLLISLYNILPSLRTRVFSFLFSFQRYLHHSPSVSHYFLSVQPSPAFRLLSIPRDKGSSR